MALKGKAGYRKWILLYSAIALLAICTAALHIVVFYYIPWKRYQGSFVHYDEGNISANEKYVGIIDWDHEKVRICTHSGREVSFQKIDRDYPNRIALGENSYFLLFWEEGENARIAQYDFQSEKMKECRVTDVADIACEDGLIFLGDWVRDEDGEEEGQYYYSFYHGLYANRYYEEGKFGGQPQMLDLKQEGRCLVGDVEMYNHDQKYFSTEPVLDDYPGISWGEFEREDKLDGYQAETRQEERNRSLLVKAIGGVEGVPKPVYSVREYQEGRLIYGICNVLEESLPHRPTKPGNVARAYFYRINPAKNQCDILAWKGSCLAIIGTDSEVIYQNGEGIVRQNLSSGKEEVICHIQNSRDLMIEVKGDFLLVKEVKGHFLPMYFSEDERKYVPVKWHRGKRR